MGNNFSVRKKTKTPGRLHDLEGKPDVTRVFTYKIVLISCYYLMNTRLICVVFVDLPRGKGVEQGLRWLGRVVSVLQVQIYRLIPEQA